jgi:hypothetical protein
VSTRDGLGGSSIFDADWVVSTAIRTRVESSCCDVAVDGNCDSGPLSNVCNLAKIPLGI